MGTINLDVKAEIAVVTLAAPPMNTLDRSMISMLATCLQRLGVVPAEHRSVMPNRVFGQPSVEPTRSSTVMPFAASTAA